MIVRNAFLAASALALLSTPAQAQDYEIESETVLDDTDYGPVTYDDAYQGEWRGDWVSPERYEGEWQGSYDANLDTRPYAPHLGYSAHDREMWLERCRAAYYPHHRRGADGALIGGIVGAAAGGLIGNRVADGHRLGGTLVGAGVGGLAGAAIGDAIDGDRYHAENRAWDYCESYLSDYEHRGAYAYGGTYPGPMMWVRAPIHRVVRRTRSDCNCAPRQEVVEEVVVEEVVETTPVTQRVVRQAPAPRGKVTKLRPVK